MIEDHLLTRLERLDAVLFLIWSFEHNAWWGPGRVGYVKDAEQAGRYRFVDAMAICAQANIVGFNEAMIPLTEAQLLGGKLPAARPNGVR